ncbi:hypothetical protein [Streptomyces rochei]|uniref:hypothetical protein n=1 Tax=Streptomyces rochei TaxID=1928 RepID=UPI0013B9370F|nr:hypothetical protein [Streptomyces rochei]NEC71000.1 hypothetical protein [Streptomyces rochei]
MTSCQIVVDGIDEEQQFTNVHVHVNSYDGKPLTVTPRFSPDESGTPRRLDNRHGRRRLGRTGRDDGATDALRVTVGHQRVRLHHGAGRAAQQDQEQEGERSRWHQPTAHQRTPVGSATRPVTTRKDAPEWC